MEVQSLIKMLNDIGAFYQTMPDKSKAIENMAKHIRAFWDPRMREAMKIYLEQHTDGKSTEGEVAEFSVKAYRYMLQNLN